MRSSLIQIKKSVCLTFNSKTVLTTAVVLVALLLCSSGQITSAESGGGGILGAATGAISGGIAGAQAGAQAGSEAGSQGLQVHGSLGPVSGSISAGGSSSSDSSMSASGSVSHESGSASASVSVGTTPKPEGLLSKMKEIVKSSVESLTKDDKKEEKKMSAEGSISAGSAGISGSASVSAGSSKSEGGLMDKISDMAKRGKEVVKEKASELKESAKEKVGELKESAREIKDDIKSMVTPESSSGGASASGSISAGSMSASANVQMGGKKESSDDGPLEKVSKVINKGTEMVRDTVQKIEDKASEMGETVTKKFDENFIKPMSQVSGSGQQQSEGRMTMQASVNSQIKPSDKERHLLEVKRKQDLEMGPKKSSLKDIIQEAKQKGVIPKNEDRSALRGNHADEKSVTVEVLDKMHEIAKIPVETVLKPIDKALGYEKDPLIRMYDNSHELLRRPISLVSKPVESFFTGAFKTTDETMRDNEKLLQTTSEQERREAKMKAEKARKENRSVIGEIADKTMELYEKPIEIVLKPVDHVLGLDKDGKKNPILKLIEEIYGLSKKPVDAIAKPFESILRKMADGEQAYQVSVRFSDSRNDPKLFTRLADGALNIADRVLTKPFELVMKPLNHALGYDEPGKKNPIVDAAHSLKNATKLGVELFTKPIDRIIKEIAEIGDIKDDAEREAMLERKRQEASRLVMAMDKFHEIVQAPFEIVLRPVGKVLGYTKDGRKEPLLRAWDVVHQVVRTPIQVVSKPVEDAILGERPHKGGFKAEAKIGSFGAKAEFGGSGGSSSDRKAGASVSAVGKKEKKKNFIVDGIKKVEKFAVKPFDVITSPIRRLILGEDDEKVGGNLEKNNRAVQAKSQAKVGKNELQVQLGAGNDQKQPDKIVKTLESMNNVVLKPLEVITQPIADILSSESKSKEKKVEVKAKGQVSAGQHEGKVSASAQIKKS